MEKKLSFKKFVVIVIFATVMVSLYYVQGDPSHSKTRAELSEKENIPSLFGISMQGVDQDEIIKNVVEKTDEFDYFGNEREGIKTVGTDTCLMVPAPKCSQGLRIFGVFVEIV